MCKQRGILTQKFTTCLYIGFLEICVWLLRRFHPRLAIDRLRKIAYDRRGPRRELRQRARPKGRFIIKDRQTTWLEETTYFNDKLRVVKLNPRA